MAEKELSEDPRSTWGATPEYKQRWNEKYGKAAEEKAEKEGDSGTSTPAVNQTSTPDLPGGAEGNQANDPTRRVASGPGTP